MNVYLAAHDSSLALAAVIVLERFGHRVISTWHDGTMTQVPRSVFDSSRLNATVNAQEILEADAAVFVGYPGEGNWEVEVGVAIGARKPVILVDGFRTCWRTCMMLHHPAVERADTVEEAALMLADVPVERPAGCGCLPLR